MNKKNPLGVLFFTIFLDMLGFGILIPIIPVLFASPTSSHYLLASETSIETGYVLLGFLVACYAFGQFFAAPIIGQFSDTLGRRKLLIFSVFGTAVGHALFAAGILLRSVPLLFAARLFAGATGGNIVVAQAAIADVTTPENRAKNFGLIGAAFGLGFIIGPFIGGKLADPGVLSWFNPTTPFWFAACLSVVNTFLVFYFFKETNTYTQKRGRVEWGKALKNIAHAFRIPSLRPLFITGFIFQMGFAFYVSFSAVYLLTHFHFSEGMIGNYFAYVGIWIVFTQGVVTRLINRWFREHSILQHSLIAVGLCILAIVSIPHSFLLYFIAPFFAMAVGLTQSNMMALISRSASQETQGEIMGISGSLNALAQTIPPLFSGMAAVFFSPAAPLTIAGVMIICSGFYFITHVRNVRK